MNKAQLIEELSSKSGVTKAEAERILNAFVEITVDAVKNGTKVTIAGLGSFELTTRAARTGVNPATGEKLEIAAKNAPKFKAAKSFKDIVA